MLVLSSGGLGLQRCQSQSLDVRHSLGKRAAGEASGRGSRRNPVNLLLGILTDKSLVPLHNFQSQVMSWQRVCLRRLRSFVSPADTSPTLDGPNTRIRDTSAAKIGRKATTQRVRTFACDERDELAHAFLHALFGFLGYLRIFWQRRLHNPSNWSEITNVSIR